MEHARHFARIFVGAQLVFNEALISRGRGGLFSMRWLRSHDYGSKHNETGKSPYAAGIYSHGYIVCFRKGGCKMAAQTADRIEIVFLARRLFAEGSMNFAIYTL
jgi:hypothetical protein